MAVLVCDLISKRKRRKDVIKNFSYNFLENNIYAIVGKSDSGLNELLDLLAYHTTPFEGTIYLDGVTYPRAKKVKEICYIKNLNEYQPKERVIDIMRKLAKFYPNWDTYYANELLEFYNIDIYTKLKDLIQTQKTILMAVLGLASKAEIIIFNHPVENVDIKARYDFFNFLYHLQEKYPRTYIITTTFIDEIDYLVDYILLIDKGKLVSTFSIDELKENFCYLTGKSEVLKSLVSGVKIIGVEERGKMLTLCVRQKLKKDDIRKYQKYLIKVSEVPIQMIFIYLLNLREIKGIN